MEVYVLVRFSQSLDHRPLECGGGLCPCSLHFLDNRPVSVWWKIMSLCASVKSPDQSCARDRGLSFHSTLSVAKAQLQLIDQLLQF